MNKRCQSHACTNPAHADVLWGDKDRQQATLCKAHVEDLWRRFGGAVNAGLMHFQIGPVGSICGGDQKHEGH